MNKLHTEQARNPERAGAPPGRRAPRTYWVYRTAWDGILGPILFTAVVLAQEALRSNEYNPVAEPVSALEAGPNGWVQQVNFIVFGVLTIGFAVGLHRGPRPTRLGIAGPALLAVSGVGAMLAGILPLREDAAGVTYDPGGHIVGGFTFFLSSAFGLIVLSRRLARDPRWRGLATYTLVAGVLAIIGFVVTGALLSLGSTPRYDGAGVAQRVLLLGVLFPCRIVLSLRLLRVARERVTTVPSVGRRARLRYRG